MIEEEKYSGLRWYLPPYFKNSLSKCRFEQGAIIYKDKPIGKYWDEKIKNIDFFIQIQFPERNWNAGSGDESVMKSNWDSEVVFDCFYPKTKENETIRTTQGRLFSFLWRDNTEILYGTEPLKRPLFKISNNSIDGHFISERIPYGDVGFAFVYNPINDTLFSKLSSIKKAASNYALEELTFSVEESCLKDRIQKEIRKEDANGIYPLLSIRLLLFKNANYEDIRELIKKVVYKPQKQKNNEDTRERFSMKSHGLLMQRF